MVCLFYKGGEVLNAFQKEIYKTVDILINKRLEHLQYDQTLRGKITAVRDQDCDVEIDGTVHTCKYHAAIQVDNIVYVKFPANNGVNKYVEAVVGNVYGADPWSFGDLDGGFADKESYVTIDLGTSKVTENSIILEGGDV